MSTAHELLGGTFTIAHRIETLLPAALEVICGWVKDNGGEATHDETGIEVETVNGLAHANQGDWVVLGINNKFAAIPHDVFIAMSQGQPVEMLSVPSEGVEGRA